MNPSVGALDADEVRRPAKLSVKLRRRVYSFLDTLCNMLLEPMLKFLVYLANKYQFGRQVLARDKGRVQAKDLITGRCLGQGCSGIFYETTWSGSQDSTVRLARKDFPGVKGNVFESEVIRLFELHDHPNIAKTLCWTVDSRSCSIVMEYMRDDLSSVMRKKKEALRNKELNKPTVGTSPSPFELLEALDISLQIATGMEYLHDEGIAHGDLKPNNVLIDWKEGQMLVKVADFGLIETKRRTTVISQRALCFRMIEWSAPELFEGYFASIGEELDYIWTTSSTGERDMSASSASDLDDTTMMKFADSYSFALICSYILGGQIWNAKLSPSQLREHISSSGLRPKLPSECPEKLASLISKCWDANPKRRPTFSVICNELQEIVKDQRKQEEQRDMRNMLQEIVKEQREQEEQRDMRNMLQDVVKELRDQEVQRQQETLGNIHNTLQEFVKEKLHEALQEALRDIRNTLQDSEKDIKELQDIFNKLQEIVKEEVEQVVQDITADISSLKPMELARPISPISEASDADSSKIAYPAPNPDMLLRKGKALVLEYAEPKESNPSVLTCTEDRETFKEFPDRIQTDRTRPDDAGPSDPCREPCLESPEPLFEPNHQIFLGLPPRVQKDFSPHTSVLHLIESFLILQKGYSGPELLTMYELLRDMGREFRRKDETHLWEARSAKATVDRNQGANKVRPRNLSRSRKRKCGAKTSTRKPSLHFPLFDGCDVNGTFEGIMKELQRLRERYMPLNRMPTTLHLSNLMSLDFSHSTQLATLWGNPDPDLEAYSNLLRALDLTDSKSIRTLPDSIAWRLSWLKDLQYCENSQTFSSSNLLPMLSALNLLGCSTLQKLPSSIDHLTALQELRLHGCGSLETLPDTVTALSDLQLLSTDGRSSISKMPTTIKHLTGLEWQAPGIVQLNARNLSLIQTKCNDEWITSLDSGDTLRSLDQLVIHFHFFHCKSITKLPETIGVLTNLEVLQLYDCDKLQELPNSIGQLKALETLDLRECTSLETLPDSLGALTNLRYLLILQCTSITELPTSIDQLSSLCWLTIEGCGGLQSLPDSIKQLDALRVLQILDCGSLEDLGALNMLQGLRIWGCTFITELPGSCLIVMDCNFCDPTWYYHIQNSMVVRQNLKELRVVEENDCGFLRHLRDTQTGRIILQRVHSSPCGKL